MSHSGSSFTHRVLRNTSFPPWLLQHEMSTAKVRETRRGVDNDVCGCGEQKWDDASNTISFSLYQWESCHWTESGVVIVVFQYSGWTCIMHLALWKAPAFEIGRNSGMLSWNKFCLICTSMINNSGKALNLSSLQEKNGAGRSEFRSDKRLLAVYYAPVF